MPPYPFHRPPGSVLNMTGLCSGSFEDTPFVPIAFACVPNGDRTIPFFLSVLFHLGEVRYQMARVDPSMFGQCLDCRLFHSPLIKGVIAAVCQFSRFIQSMEGKKWLKHYGIFVRVQYDRVLRQNSKFPGHVSRLAVFEVGSEEK